MTERTVRTSTHNYPYEEVHAMMDFYDGKTCVLTHNRLTVHWAHILDAALPTSHERLRWMLERHLRQERHPRHAAEVRENVIP